MRLRWRTDSYLQRIDVIPPKLALLLARRDRVPISLREIGDACGLEQSRLREIFRLPSWGSLPLEQVDRIRKACGITPANERKHIAYLKRSVLGPAGFAHNKKRGVSSRMKLAMTLGSEEFRRRLDLQIEAMATDLLGPGQKIGGFGVRKRRGVDAPDLDEVVAAPSAVEPSVASTSVSEESLPS